MSKLIAIIATYIVLCALPAFSEDSQSYRAKSEDYTVESIGQVEVEVTTPVTELTTLDEVDAIIQGMLYKIDAYNAMVSELIRQVKEVKEIRDRVEEAAAGVLIKRGQGT